jgi:hypothetical protein
MRSTVYGPRTLNPLRRLRVAVGAVAVLASATLWAQQAPSSASEAAQKTFATARQAAEALLAAADAFDRPALKAILGPDGDYLVAAGEPAQDRAAAAAFAARAREKLTVVTDPKDPNRATLSVGNDDWPLAIPIVRTSGSWRFDSKAGRQELLYRRIGENELDAIQICRGYVEAQHEYALMKREGSTLNQYAQRIISSPGKQDGLAWQNPDGTWGGPVGENIARAIELGYSDKALPYHGYFFRVLKGQGPAAPMGEMDFVVKSAMIGGFALVASPAEYGTTGVMTFIVSHDGVVYQKDFGADTASAFKAMEHFNPDTTWTPVIEK